MKKILILTCTVLFSNVVLGQAPRSFKYQAVARDAAGQIMANHQVNMQISILQDDASGSAVYVEQHAVTANQFGLLDLTIGKGSIVMGDLASVEWHKDVYFLKVEMNGMLMGTTQLLSVPYAMHAEKAGSLTGEITESQISDLQSYLTSESDPVFITSPAGNITAGSVNDWNTSYSWGNHASAGYVPETRTLTINGISLDLSGNRGWSVGTVTSVGLTLPNIFSVLGSPVTEGGTLTASLVHQTPNRVFASPLIFTGAPSFRSLVSADIPNLPWSKITSGTPTTLAGFGITDAVNTIGNQTINGIKTFSNPIMADSGLDAGNKTITNLAAPVNYDDAANRSYVDNHNTYAVGDRAHGGIVFYVDETGQHGLVCATTDFDVQIPWSWDQYVTCAFGDGVFSGEMNTALIVAKQGDEGSNWCAGLKCSIMRVYGYGRDYGDWYLPSKSELSRMYSNKVAINTTALRYGGSAFANEYYWSSTEEYQTTAWGQNFLNGVQIAYDKQTRSYVRAVLAF